ncbi:MAG: exonuclease domain-containing protein [Candidatus Peregrinibacteria bacterium]|nr:exonuclease domain-containing protein [Candidatus Peregrinibacteria bacterium]
MYIALDLETTGFDPVSDYPIEVAAIKFDENGIYERYQTLVNPGVPIPQIVSHITGIHDEDVANAPKLEDVKQQIIDFIGDLPIVGHNITFDTSFLRNKGFGLVNNVEFDTLPLTATLYPKMPSYSLETLSAVFGIADKQNHRAMSDTIACATLFQKLLKKIQTLSPEILQTIRTIFGETTPHYSLLFQGGKKGGAYIEENLISKPKKEFQSSSKQGEIETAVLEALEKNETLLLEIGIGNGKYTALMNALMRYHKNNKDKTLISLATPGLQENLFHSTFSDNKDIILIKETGRYLSPSRLKLEMEKENKSFEEAAFFSKIYLWSTYTSRGEQDELCLNGEEYRKWERVNINPWRCKIADEPFMQKAYKEQEQAKILVCYHRALAKEIIAPSSHLHDIKNLIVCEADHFEKHIFSATSRTFSLDGLEEKYKLTGVLHDSGASLLWEKMQFFFGMLGLIYRKYTERDLDVLFIQDTHKNTKEWIQIQELYQIIITYLTEHMSEQPDIYGELLEELSVAKSLFVEGEAKSSSMAMLGQNHAEEIRLRYMPIETMETVWNMPFFKDQKTRIFLSSTMRVAKSFDYIRERLSLNDENIKEIVIGPRPDLIENVKIIIPAHLPDQEKSEYNMHANALMGKIIKDAPGKTIAIFGSKRTLHNAYYALATNLRRSEIDLLSQDFSGGKGKIGEKYRADPEHTVLFGTFAFFEKIELSKLPYENFIFQKIPFDPPSDPLIQMQNQRYMNAFTQYSLPEATLRFLGFLNQFLKNPTPSTAQKNLYIFDTRILHKSWGDAILDSLPEGITVMRELPEGK